MPIPPPDVPVWKRLRKRDIDELDEASNTTHVPKRWHLPVKWHLAHTGCFPAARPGSQYAHGGRGANFESIYSWPQYDRRYPLRFGFWRILIAGAWFEPATLWQRTGGWSLQKRDL